MTSSMQYCLLSHHGQFGPAYIINLALDIYIYIYIYKIPSSAVEIVYI
jgi:hypothetical protein